MYLGRPNLAPLLIIKSINDALAGYINIKNISAGIGVYGSASAYALVWELGSRRLKKPGPKTVWSQNRLGQKAILTKQAPFGYVGIAVNQFWPIIKDELNRVQFDPVDAKRTALNLEIAMDNAAQRMSKIVADIAPVDSGDLRSQILQVDSDELDFLDTASDADLEASGTLLL
jgi:hypothetical protein